MAKTSKAKTSKAKKPKFENVPEVVKARKSGKPYVVFDGRFNVNKGDGKIEVERSVVVQYLGYNDTEHLSRKAAQGFEVLEFGGMDGDKAYFPLREACKVHKELSDLKAKVSGQEDEPPSEGDEETT